MPFWADWTFWLLFAAWLPFALFVVFYAIGSPTWWHTPIGRGLMAVSGSLAAILTFALLVRIFPFSQDAKALLRVVTFGGVIVAGFMQLSALLREQREARRIRSDPPR